MFTPVGDLPASSASYSGFTNIGDGLSSSTTNAYLSRVTLNVDFGAGSDQISGSLTDFALWTDGSTIYTTTMPAVGGSFAITGDLTGVNSSVGNGLTGTAVGNIAGTGDTLVMTGHFSGDDGELVGLYFNGTNFSGVGTAAR